jgi:hypothetical protein
MEKRIKVECSTSQMKTNRAAMLVLSPNLLLGLKVRISLIMIKVQA